MRTSSFPKILFPSTPFRSEKNFGGTASAGSEVTEDKRSPKIPFTPTAFRSEKTLEEPPPQWSEA